MKRTTALFLILTFYVSFAFGAESFSYSGRLINSNGSPVPGPVDLRFELAYSNQLGILLCSQNLNGVMLSNGVFHANLDFPDCDLEEILNQIPVNNNLMIRVVDTSSANPTNYSFQAIHSIPLSMMSHVSRQLLQMGANLGQVLTWDGTGWAPADPASSTQGTVTSLTVADGLYGGTITESGIIGIQDGGVTSQKLHNMGATPGQVLKWTVAGWAPDEDSDSEEVDPSVRAFARTDITGITPEICGNNQALRFISVDSSLRCFDLVKDVIVASEDKLAPSQKAVAEALDLKQDEIKTNTELILKSLVLTNADSSWIGLQSPSASGNFFFTLPPSPGTPGQFLKTNGTGNLVWDTPSVGSSNIAPGSIDDTHISSISTSKITGLDGQLNSINTSLLNIKDTVRSTELDGLTPATGTIGTADSILVAFNKIVGNANALSADVSTLATNQNKYLEKGGGTMSGDLVMNGHHITGLAAPLTDNDAATMKYVNDEITANSYWTKTGTEVSYLDGDVNIGNKLRLKSTNTNYVELISPGTLASTITFTLPETYGSNNQFLKTDASGNLSWANVTTGTITEVTSSAPLIGSGTSGSVNISLIANSLTDSHIASGANIDWSKINKTGAAASDLGAVPATRQIITSTGLLGGGNLSADKTLSVDVGTNAGQILQVGLDGKLPVVDGSNLTNFTWSQILPATLPLINAGAGLTTTGSLASGQTLNVDVGTTANKIVSLDGSARLPAVDGSQLTNLGTNLGKWSDATGGINYTGGNVGIGTSSPGSKFHVEGTSLFSSPVANHMRIHAAGDNYGGSAPLILSSDNETGSAFYFVRGISDYNANDEDGGIAGQSETFFIRGDGGAFFNGNVGVGTKNPIYYFTVAPPNVTVESSSTVVSQAQKDSTISVQGDGQAYFLGRDVTNDIEFAMGSSSVGHAFSGSTTNHDYRLRTNNLNRLSITTSGNVGIGTTSPSGLLDINTGNSSRVVKYIEPQTMTYTRSVILLHEVYTGTLLNENHVIGRIFGRRGSSTSLHRHEVADIRTGSAYNGTTGQLTSLSSGNLKWKLVTLNYNGIKYMAVDVPYMDANLSSGFVFDGFVRSTAPDSLKFVDYYNVQSGAVLNAEINSSIADFTPSGQEHKDVSKLTVSGILGVGTYSPAAPLDVALYAADDPNSPSAIFARGADQNFQMMAMSGSASNSNGSLIGKFGMRYMGGLGVGDTAMMRFYRGSTNLDGRMAIATNDLDRLTVSAVGNVGIGTDAPGYRLTVNGQPAANGYTAFTNYSDRRLKENIERVGDGVLEKVVALKPTTFNYNDKYFDITGYDPETKKTKVTGFIAQELKEVFPEMVNEKKISDESFLDTNLSSLQIYLVKAIKEMFARWQSDSHDLHEEIQSLKFREIATIKKENQELKDKVKQKEKEMAQMQDYLCKKDPSAPFCKK